PLAVDVPHADQKSIRFSPMGGRDESREMLTLEWRYPLFAHDRCRDRICGCATRHSARTVEPYAAGWNVQHRRVRPCTRQHADGWPDVRRPVSQCRTVL